MCMPASSPVPQKTPGKRRYVSKVPRRTGSKGTSGGSIHIPGRIGARGHLSRGIPWAEGFLARSGRWGTGLGHPATLTPVTPETTAPGFTLFGLYRGGCAPSWGILEPITVPQIRQVVSARRLYQRNAQLRVAAVFAQKISINSSHLHFVLNYHILFVGFSLWIYMLSCYKL